MKSTFKASRLASIVVLGLVLLQQILCAAPFPDYVPIYPDTNQFNFPGNRRLSLKGGTTGYLPYWDGTKYPDSPMLRIDAQTVGVDQLDSGTLVVTNLAGGGVLIALVGGSVTNLAASGNANEFLNGNLEWSVPAGGGGGGDSLWTNNAGVLEPFPAVDTVTIKGATDRASFNVYNLTQSSSFGLSVGLHGVNLGGGFDDLDPFFNFASSDDANSVFQMQGWGGSRLVYLPDADGVTNSAANLEIRAPSRTAGDIISVFADPAGTKKILGLAVYGGGADHYALTLTNDPSSIQITISPTSAEIGMVGGSSSSGVDLYVDGVNDTFSIGSSSGGGIFTVFPQQQTGVATAILKGNNRTDGSLLQITADPDGNTNLFLVKPESIEFSDRIRLVLASGGSNTDFQAQLRNGVYDPISFDVGNNDFTITSTYFNFQTSAQTDLTTARAHPIILNSVGGASDGTQAWSPSLAWHGSGWSTGFGASRGVIFDAILEPIQGSEATGMLRWYGSVSTNAIKQTFGISSEGPVKLASVTKAEKTALVNVEDGMLVYQTDNTPGFRGYVNGTWFILSTAADP